MYLSIPSVLAALALAATASADKFKTANGVYDVDASNGCRGTSVPGMIEFCVDWPNARAHFKFAGWTGKSCLKETSHSWETCGDYSDCANSYFTPVKCTW
ncbi:hypothetical protein C8A00DRAFT_31281 [Chaetomidium leptoderma]|uniref:Uncharacterized protein n=1 Tax=Chaetomidium leptoderma TaxID=669021 RepID=A0AAN6VQB1_9PEZI|nr:hypothetical protein C8A00DRAFT_31281 [Chaetomidium leptoderma]